MQDVNVIADRSSYAEIDCPAVVIDKEGNILLWYLPNAFRRGAEIWNSLGNLSIPLARSVKSNRAGGWWHDSNHFRPAADLKGAIDLSLAWFQQGRGVSHYPFEDDFTLKSQGANETRQWLDSMAGLHASSIGCIAKSCTRKCTYTGGRRSCDSDQWQSHGKTEDMQAVLPIWNSVYSSMSLMSPPHKDTNGRKVWLDTLLTVGRYTPLDFVVPELGMQEQSLVHQVDSADGNRACLAYYMRREHIPLCCGPHISDIATELCAGPCINVDEN
ncbi:hypothetical protein BKA82DRAFT_170024 [Pisolithus tinctorius]|nr:hypothetical protein BKA82DRAFT_170024 [Pisolithus tinctorius]